MIQSLEDTLGYHFRDEALLMRALTHTSWAAEHPGQMHNERLEFLGDTVLQMIATDYLYDHYPKLDEGVMTRMRASAVGETSLAKIARDIHLQNEIRVGTGTRRDLPSIMSDAMEAVLAAIYLEAGIEPCRAFMQERLIPAFETARANGGRDEKSRLQEYLQENGTVRIEYRLLERTGPVHDSVFTVGVYCNDRFLAKGMGKSKKAAEQNAAAIALAKRDKESVHEA